MLKELMKKKIWFFIFAIIIVGLVINNVYLLINIAGLHGIENALRLIGSVILVILMLLNIFLIIKSLMKGKNIFLIIMLIITLIINIGIGFLNFNFNKIYNKLNKVTTNYTTYSISLVTYTENEVNDIKGLGSEKIGIINDHEIANGYTFGEEIIKENKLKNELVEYESYVTILDDLINKKIKYAFLPSNYVEVFQTIEGYNKISTQLKTIFEKSKQEKQEPVLQKSVTEPFTVLLMGVDSTEESIANSSANGDSLMFITFNPNTLKATMVSIPRDSYVPITCMSNRKNKITHSAWGGESCIINTVSQFFGLKIDYYVKINFTGIVKLVDTLKGIDVDIEYKFCEQNSKREWGPNAVYLEKGFQTINGEQALGYARNRHPNYDFCDDDWTDYESNDFIRGVHQQDIVKAILTKLKDVRDLETFYGILDTISDNMETNMDRNTILSFYNVAKDIVIKSKDAKDINDLINIQKMYISGKDASIYDYSQYSNSGMRMNLYNFVPSPNSVKAVVNAMNINLGKADKTIIKTFSYDANSPYEQEVIGKGVYGGYTLEQLPDFIGSPKEIFENYAKTHNIGTPTYVEKESDKPVGIIIEQDPPCNIDLENINPNVGITITISSGKKKVEEEKETDYSICKEDGATDEICTLSIEKFIGKNHTILNALKDIITITEVTVTDGATEDNAGRIKSIDNSTSGTIDLTSTDSIKVEYYLYVNEEDNKEDNTGDNTSDNNNDKIDDNTGDNNNDNNTGDNTGDNTDNNTDDNTEENQNNEGTDSE